ncbi:MAG TPA: DUF3079 domain-containing protein [Albitalea sp.]
MAKKFPVHPKHPERNCWGCDLYCASNALACGNGSERTQHPVELFGDDWLEWGLDAAPAAAASAADGLPVQLPAAPAEASANSPTEPARPNPAQQP